MTRDDIKRIALEVLEEHVSAQLIFKSDLEVDQKTRAMDAIAQDIADRVTREAM